jgi:hypothetical protein
MIDESFILLLRNTNTNCSSAGADVLFDVVVAARFGVRWAWCRRQHTTQPNHQLNN